MISSRAAVCRCTTMSWRRMSEAGSMSGPSAQPAPRKQRGPRPKHVPQRMCIACREHDAKRSYVRLVRTPEQQVAVDPTGKQNGRGAYLCRRRACWRRGIDTRAIDRALKIELDEQARERLWEYATSHFPPDEAQPGGV